jgi:hypothetical protein
MIMCTPFIHLSIHPSMLPRIHTVVGFKVVKRFYLRNNQFIHSSTLSHFPHSSIITSYEDCVLIHPFIHLCIHAPASTVVVGRRGGRGDRRRRRPPPPLSVEQHGNDGGEIFEIRWEQNEISAVGFGNRMGDIQYTARSSRCDRQTPNSI